MFLVFTAIFVIADYPMHWIDQGRSWLADLVLRGLLEPGPLRSLLVDGVIGGVGSVVKFVPQIMILFALHRHPRRSAGYMQPRAAFLMDRLMSRAGLNGKSFIPLLSSMACAVPGILSARVIENRRDRLATILVAPLMSCSARLPVYGLLIGAFLPLTEYPWYVPVLTFFGLYMIGFIVAPAMAFLLKSTLLRGDTPVFVMEMPLYKFPAWQTVLRRALESAWMFLKRAGTMILASMVLVWAALYFPSGDFEQRIAELETPLEKPREQLKEMKEALAKLKETDAIAAKRKEKEIEEAKDTIEPQEKKINELRSEWKGQSILGRVGHWIEPAVEPLGWDWRIGMAALASFPAREVMVGTLGIIFGEGEGEADDDEFRASVGQTLRAGFTLPVALSVLVFFALCCQCASTLVIIKRETNTWGWPVFTFVYMTALAYVGALVTYQVARMI